MRVNDGSYSRGLDALDLEMGPNPGLLNPRIQGEGQAELRTSDEGNATETPLPSDSNPGAPSMPDRGGASIEDFLDFMHGQPQYAQLVDQYRAAEASPVATPNAIDSTAALVVYRPHTAIQIVLPIAAEEPEDFDAEFSDDEEDLESLEEPRQSSRRRRFIGKLKDRAKKIPTKAHEATERLAKPVKRFTKILQQFVPGLISERHPYQRRG